MREIIPRRYYRFFGFKKYIVVAVHKENKERKQFIVISRKSQHAVHEIKEKIAEHGYQYTAYTETQYAHLLKLRY